MSGEGLEAHWPLDSDAHIPHMSLRDGSPAPARVSLVTALDGARVMLDVSGNGRHLELKKNGTGVVGMESRYRADGQV